MEGILGSDFGQSGSDGVHEFIRGSGLCTAQMVLELAPHLFDGVEVWRVGWQEEHLHALLGQQFKGGLAFVGGQVVHDEDVSGFQRGAEDLLHVGAEHLGVGGAFNGHAGGGAIQADGAEHGGGAPMPAGGAGMDSSATQGPAAQPGQVGLGPALIDKDQAGGI
jgi:hypothetical protein